MRLGRRARALLYAGAARRTPRRWIVNDEAEGLAWAYLSDAEDAIGQARSHLAAGDTEAAQGAIDEAVASLHNADHTLEPEEVEA
jgi:predicted Zn-dependent protease